MEWGRIVVPLSGSPADAAVLAGAAGVAERFEAELAAVYAPPDLTELTPWLGEGFVGGVQASAIESLREAGTEGEKSARATYDALPYAKKTFLALKPPVWRAMALEVRLADLVVFDDAAAKGKGPFAENFEQVLMEERAATYVCRAGCNPFGTAVVAWDGGEPASRAARRALPLLRKANRVVIIGAPPSDRPCDLRQLQSYYAARGVSSEVRPLERSGDMAPVLTAAVAAEGADLLVAGAFGRSRLREFIFGGTTRALLHADRPSLFVAH
jgi:nucleotide-binding universal stress UspA family protein